MTEPERAPVPNADVWGPLRATTPARIGLDRHGWGLSTRTALDLGTAHALARDAVHLALGVESLADDLRGLGLGESAVVHSAAPDRTTYLARPDLGRRPAAALDLVRPAVPVDLAVVVCDGLSSTAVQQHAAPLLAALTDRLNPELAMSAPIIGVQGRVALGDHIAAHLGADLLLVLIGERPGLTSHDSLGAYLTWKACPGTADADRNCVSNIRPSGLGYDQAAVVLADLIHRAHAAHRTGVELRGGGPQSVESGKATTDRNRMGTSTNSTGP
jgi:ethanolamine ammonia-lyase small subunit